MDERSAYEVVKGGLNMKGVITTLQWLLGVLAFGLYCGIEQAEGWQILINMGLTISTGITIWLLERLKGEMNNAASKRKSTRSISKISNV